MSKYFLGLDNGGTITKSVIFDMETTDIIAKDCIKTEIIFPRPLYREKDIKMLWQSNLQVIKNVVEKSSIDSNEIVAMAITGHGNGIYLCDQNGEPTYNGVMSTDLRAEKYVKKMLESRASEELYGYTMQEIWAGQPSLLLQWFRDNAPDVMKNTKWIMTCKDYIRFKFTNEAYAEITDISGTQLLNNKTENYDDNIFDILGLSEYKDKFPPLKKSTDICGYITDEVASITGLKKGMPVYGGLFDITSCAIATGALNEDILSVVAGTWGINQYVLKNTVDTKSWMTSIYPIKDYLLHTEASPTSASNLQWAIDNLYSEEKKSIKNIFKYCDDSIKNLKDHEKLIFLPFIFGSNIVPTSGGLFAGIEASHSKIDLLKSVYEGIVFSHKYHIDKLNPMPCKIIRLSGGASNSDIWCQMFSDILDMPVQIIKGSEFGALGCAITASVGSKFYGSFEEAVHKTLKVEKTYNPNIDRKDYYNNKYSNYKTICGCLESYWNV